ncbi:3-oxoacyl-ACP reductase family protein [Pseudomonas sp. ADAK13]|jgi:3-oxoacyl-[acyl-carrier protein] reductase|uniref:3-oxoacyl-ACP reductase family protein n=1 Tax=Pseudomonas sp. ADAK13 TaxID=2730847 RepID=UPI001463C481|nr:3-oxoacyl-ACP reductase family protein [Pseudomonas sp. ADAK13]QJI38926.1 3-oxoacyl-ACP reductase FabG [Pseudomonas sp. ADAK13]
MTIPTPRFSSKVALVTGGSRGIGEAIVRRLAAEGAAVAFTYSSSADKALALVGQVESEGGKALAIQADSADAVAIERAVSATVERFGTLNILVNNAGILQLGSVDEFSLEDFDRMFAVNVRATFAAAKASSPVMQAGDRIITVGSVVAQRSGFPGSSVYSMTKSAIAGMIRGLAIDFAPRGITVNNVQPGPTGTDMNPADGPHAGMIKSLIPLGRVGTADEIAGMVAYLASEEAAFVTGASLTIDGGYLA